MAALSDAMKAVFAKNRVFSLATASRDGAPNVAPMAMVELAGDDVVWIGDNYMSKTLANVAENPRAALFFWDPETKQCFQVKGAISIRNSGPEYEGMRERIKAKGAHYPAKGLLVLSITEIYQCTPGSEAGRPCE